jgi:hypothetical protein
VKNDRVEISYSEKNKKWEIKTFHGSFLMSHYKYEENDSLGFIARLTNSMIEIREKNVVLRRENE